MDAETKVCSVCKVSLPFSSFTVRRASIDGLSYKCRICASEYQKKRYADNDDVRSRAKDRARHWVKSNMVRRKEIAIAYELRNIEKKRERNKVYAKIRRAIDPEKARMNGRIAAQNRRHRMNDAGGWINKGVMRRMLEKSNGVCTYCGETFESLTIDHFHPVSKGGSGAWHNIAPCCSSCNSSKKDKDGPTWIEKRFGVDVLVYVYWRLEQLSAARLP